MVTLRIERSLIVRDAVKAHLEALRPGLGERTKIFRQFGLGGVDKVVIVVYPKGTGQEGTSGSDSPS